MSKDIIHRIFPNLDSVRGHKNLRFLGNRLDSPDLWHLNRSSVPKALAIGVFCSWIPSIGQMPIAAILAMIFRANIPISVLLIFISNPLTIPPMVIAAYGAGAWMIGVPFSIENIDFSSMEGLINGLAQVWQPFLLGCLGCALFTGTLAYFGGRLFWRYQVLARWKQRARERADRA
jgi:uncharacterized protein (DUF2062 family)